MSWWADFKDKIKRYYRFDIEEIKTIVIVTIVLAFIFSFKGWGVDKFDWAYGLTNLIKTMLVVLLSVLVSVSAHKIAALYLGFRAEIRLWWYGLLIGLAIVVVTKGNLFFLAGIGVLYHHLAFHRIGFFRYGLNYWDQAKCAFAGPLANIFLAAIIKIIATGSIVVPMGFAGSPLVETAIRFNLWYAVFNMLPIPPLAGTVAFYASRMWYVFIFGCILGYSLLVLGAGIYSALATIAGGLVLLVLFYIFFEKAAIGGGG